MVKIQKTNSATHIQRKIIAGFSFFLTSIILSFNAIAIETNIAMHQGSESATQGFSIYISDKFSPSSNFYWGVGYSNLDDIKVEWNDDDLFFKVDSVDAVISYRYQPKTYNKIMRELTFEYQMGASYALTENKFVWSELDEEKYFTQKNDVNVLLGGAVHYNTSKNSAVNLGFKYQPSFSELGSITSVYLGFTYKFGKQVGY